MGGLGGAKTYKKQFVFVCFIDFQRFPKNFEKGCENDAQKGGRPSPREHQVAEPDGLGGDIGGYYNSVYSVILSYL